MLVASFSGTLGNCVVLVIIHKSFASLPDNLSSVLFTSTMGNPPRHCVGDVSKKLSTSQMVSGVTPLFCGGGGGGDDDEVGDAGGAESDVVEATAAAVSVIIPLSLFFTTQNTMLVFNAF